MVWSHQSFTDQLLSHKVISADHLMAGLRDGRRGSDAFEPHLAAQVLRNALPSRRPRVPAGSGCGGGGHSMVSRNIAIVVNELVDDG